MLGIAVLATLLQVAPDALGAAQEAFARGDYARAEDLAAAEAQPPHEGAALYLAGLARFRAGRPADALAALDAAGRAEDPPPRGPWQYNRGACLYELERFGEAEAAYEEAAALDPALAPVALVDAGFAALDAGAPDRARAFARRARAAASGRALDLVDDLDARIEDRAGAAAVGHDAAPDPADAATRAAGARPAGWVASLRVGAAYDDNVLQSGVLEPGAEGARAFAPSRGQKAGSLAGTANAFAARRWRLGDDLSAELAYGLDEVAYAGAAAADYSVQQHAVAASLELAIAAPSRLGAYAAGQLAFTGLGAFRGLQRAGALGAWLELDEAERTTTRLDVAFTRKAAARSEFSYLTGWRADLALSQELRLPRVVLGAAYRHRDESIGTLVQAAQLGDLFGCGIAAAACSDVVPLGYSSHTAALSARARLAPRVDAGVGGGVEWRAYQGDSFVATPRGELDRRRREDTSWFGGAWATVRLPARLELTLRYDLVVNASNVARAPPERGCGFLDPGCHALDYDDKNYAKQVVGLESVWRW